MAIFIENEIDTKFDFDYNEGRCEVKGNSIISLQQLQDMIKKSGDFIC